MASGFFDNFEVISKLCGAIKLILGIILATPSSSICSTLWNHPMSRNQKKEKNMQGKQQIKFYTKLGETMFECHSHVIYKVLSSLEQI